MSFNASRVPTRGQRAEPSLVAFARQLQGLQRSRAGHLGGDLFGDPAWDILLDLFISHHEHKRLSVSAVCIGVSGSSATALRYLALLQVTGLVSRTQDASDGRRSYVDLTPIGLSKLKMLLGSHAAN